MFIEPASNVAVPLDVVGNTVLTGTLQVTSTSQFDDDMTIGSTKVVIDAQTGNMTTAGTTTGHGLAT